MAAQQAHADIASRRICPAPRPGPLAAHTESGFARFFLPAFLAALLTTAGLAWESWQASEPPHTGTVVARLSF